MKIQFFLFVFLLPFSLFSQNENQPGITDTLSFIRDLFEGEEPINLTLKSDFRKFSKEKFKGKYQNAELSYQLQDTIITNKIKIKARGKNRKENCSFPPISINFKNSGLNSNNNQSYKLKMVVHCNANKVYEKYLLKEYLCYKLHSSLTDKSFKVRLLKIKYINTGYKTPKITEMFAFFIENPNMMAKRLNAGIDKKKTLTQLHINQEQIMELAMFQYMIGNFDWAVPTQQNLKLIRPESIPDTIYAIPYDFDYSGMVNANYAVPNEKLGISNVTQRLYLGECKPMSNFLPVINKFKKHKNKFYEVINSFKYLSENDKTRMIKYLDKYYKQLDTNTLYKHIKRSCKKIRQD